jgi:hypothetical protein
MALLALTGRAWGELPPFHLEVSQKTTRITQPLLPDGTIDYVQGLWQAMSAGVTADNNAATLLQQVDTAWQRYGQGVTDQDQFNRMDGKLALAESRPWSPEAFPEVAAWLARNRAALDLFAAAAQRPRLCPPVPPAGERPSLVTLHLGMIRDACNALNARALQRIAAHDFTGARADLVTIQRISALLVNAPDLLGVLTAHALLGLVDRTELAAIRALPVEEAQRWLAFRLAAPDIRLSVPAIDIGVRYYNLNNVMLMLRGKGAQAIKDITSIDVESLFAGNGGATPVMPGDLDVVDWNLVLRHINAIDDEAVQVVNEPDLVKREEAVRKLSERLEREQVPGNVVFSVTVKPPISSSAASTEPVEDRLKDNYIQQRRQMPSFFQRREGESIPAFSERIGQFFSYPESLDSVFQLDSRHQTRRFLYTVAMALEVYKARSGGYPDSLALLVPGYLQQLPLDPFSGKELLYQHTSDSYQLTSAGPTNKNDITLSSADVPSTTQPTK